MESSQSVKPIKQPKPKVNKDGSTTRKRLDTQGNQIIATDRVNVINIDLKLKSEKKRRHVGDITKSTRTFFIMRKRQYHLHLLSNSYGFNYTILEQAQHFDYVSIQDEFKRWKVRREDLLKKENQTILHFKQQGFEVQIFISLDKLDELSKAYRPEGVTAVF